MRTICGWNGPVGMKVLVILNDALYGTERSYNGLRLARSLANSGGTEVNVFLIGDSAARAKSGQTVAKGYCNIEGMLRSIARHGGSIGVCGTCIDARGIAVTELAKGCHRSSMDELTDWTLQAAQILVF